MKVKRVVPNTTTQDLDKATRFYGEILGLELLMDHGWFRTFGSDAKTPVQVSFGSEGGSKATQSARPDQMSLGFIPSVTVATCSFRSHDRY